MPNHMNDEELNQVSGGLISYSNDSGEELKPTNHGQPAIKAICKNCQEVFVGPSSLVSRDVAAHESATGHLCAFYSLP